jgi:primosomal replication protein N
MNQVVITGEVSKPPKFSKSPVGVVHGQFSIEHRSTQFEAEYQRQAYVRMHVVTCGELLEQQTVDLKVGDAIKVSGFLNRHESKNGMPIIALHAQLIERLN